jgi:hypothetical protein
MMAPGTYAVSLQSIRPSTDKFQLELRLKTGQFLNMKVEIWVKVFLHLPKEQYRRLINFGLKMCFMFGSTYSSFLVG